MPANRLVGYSVRFVLLKTLFEVGIFVATRNALLFPDKLGGQGRGRDARRLLKNDLQNGISRVVQMHKRELR